MASSTAKVRNLVILDGNPVNNWDKIFKNYLTLPDRSQLRILQSSWYETALTRYGDASDVQLLLAPVYDSFGLVKRPSTLMVKPDFLIVRNQVRALSVEGDKRNVLYGLMISNIPSVNSLHSIYMCLERPVMYAALAEIQERLGAEKFPLIPYQYYSNYTNIWKDLQEEEEMKKVDELEVALTTSATISSSSASATTTATASAASFAPNAFSSATPSSTSTSASSPMVMKISHAHRGMGKIQLKSKEELAQMASVLGVHASDYCTVEPFIASEYGLRVQKIGKDHYRVFKKVFTGSGWKSQFGGSDLQEIPMKPEYKLWVDECSKVFGGIDILAVDALHGVDGKDYIIELNDTAIGLTPGFWEKDTEHLRTLVLEKLHNMFPASTAPSQQQ